MTRVRKDILLPAIAFFAGGAGFFLRRWELATAFEEGSGLAIPMAGASLALLALTLAVAAAAFFLARGKHSPFPGGYDQAFGAKGNTVYLAAMAAGALLLLGAAAAFAVQLAGERESASWELAYGGTNPLLATLPKGLLALLSLLACPCVLWVGRRSYRGEKSGKYAAPLLAPAYLGCVWLIVAYQDRAADPVVLDYAYELFGVVASLLALYAIAGFSFEKGRVTRCAFCCAMGVFFSLVTLADRHGLAVSLLYCAMAVILTAQLAVLLANDARYRDVPAAPQGPRMPLEGEEEAADPDVPQPPFQSGAEAEREEPINE